MPPDRSVDYDQAAGNYAAHRQVHHGVLHELGQRGRLRASSVILETGCGTGNYVCGLAESYGCQAFGLDPSVGMLAQARSRRAQVTWILGGAEQLCFDNGTFDLAFSVDVIHHITDKATFYRQVARILRLGGRVCTVTDSEDIIRQREILSGYFPETVEKELARYPRIAQLEDWMAAAGLVEFETDVVKQPYEITNAQPFRDKAYSALHLIPGAAWRAGLERLEHDLASGPIRGASRYCCVWGRKA
jgi:ubiquinone/menaquinone biosynthesis C-methylase UbiE